MTNNYDDDFEQYLAGDSAISQLYARSKTGSAPDRLSQSILDQAKAYSTTAFERTDKENTDKYGTSKNSHNRYFIPFAVAATVLLSFGVFMHFSPDSHDRKIDTVALSDVPTPQVFNPEITKLHTLSNDNSSSSINNPLTSEITAGSTNTGNVIQQQIQLAQVTKSESLLPETQPGTSVEENHVATSTDNSSVENNANTIDKDAIFTDRKDVVTTDKTSNTVVLNIDDRNETIDANKSGPADETVASDDTDLSLDWMKRLSPKNQLVPQFTTSASNTMTAEKWVEEILQLHKDNKHQEAKKNIVEFRKLYPRYTLPEVLHRYYE